MKNRFMAARVGNQKRAQSNTHDDSVYRRLANKGMFGGDVVSGIGLSETVKRKKGIIIIYFWICAL